jgi:membrane protein DedA with SNARE-associated domain
MSYEQWPYLTVFFVLIIASFGFPIPEDVPLLTGGWLVHEGLASLPVMLAVAMVGVLTGDVVLFTLGRTLGHRVVERPLVRRMVSPKRLLVAERQFEKHGIKILFAARFLPGLRAMIFVASGVLKVPFWKFAAVNGLAASISVPTLILLGRLFGHKIDQLKKDVSTVGHLVTLLAIVLALVIAGIALYRRQRRMMAEVSAGSAADEVSAVPPPSATLEEAGPTERGAEQAARPRARESTPEPSAPPRG